MSKLDYRKFERLELVTIRNAMRLHDDSILMLKMGRYPTAFQLSILALEEFGKLLVIEDITWNRRFNHMSDEWTQKWFSLTLDHKFKQMKLTRDMKFFEEEAMKLIQAISHGDLERKRQDSTYAGLVNNSVHGQIVSPFKFTQKDAINQIRKNNSNFLELARMIRAGMWELDCPDINTYIKRVVYPKLERRATWLNRLP